MTVDKSLAIAGKIKKHYLNGDLTEFQFKVLIGLVTSGDHDGAIKGLHKILRRNKRSKQ